MLNLITQLKPLSGVNYVSDYSETKFVHWNSINIYMYIRLEG